MIPPPVCWPEAGRWHPATERDVKPATYFAVGEITQVVGMIPPPGAGGASVRSFLILSSSKCRLGTAEAGRSDTSCLVAGPGPTGRWGQHQVVG